MSIEVIKPREITGKILTLIEETVDEVKIVSPYIDISQWTKVKQALKRAKKRGVQIIVYLREDQASSAWMIEPFADSIHLVERLHAKLYLNSSSAVFTSMNLVQTSDEKSTDLGIFTTDQKTLSSFEDFIKTYLRPEESRLISDVLVNDQSNENYKIESESDFLKKLGIALKNESPDSKWTKSSTYWFSGNAAPAGDLMISTDNFTWKLYKNSDGSEEYAEWFADSVKAEFPDEIEVVISRDHKRYIYAEAEVKNSSNQLDLLKRLLKHLVNR